MSDRDEMAMRFAVVALETVLRNHTSFLSIAFSSEKRFVEAIEAIPQMAYEMADRMAANKEKELEAKAKWSQFRAGTNAQVP